MGRNDSRRQSDWSLRGLRTGSGGRVLLTRCAGSAAGIVLFALLFCQTAAAHKEPVHQYIVREGYELLRTTYGQEIPELSQSIGLADPSAVGDSAWQMGFVTTGAWREDAEDVVYHYDILLGLNYALTSITHFWSADRGDDAANMIRLQIEQPPLPPVSTDIGPYPNAFSKMMKFAEGGWVLYYPRSFTCTNRTNAHRLTVTPLVSAGGFGVPLSYAGLTSFFTTGELMVEHEAVSLCTVWDSTDARFVDLNNLSSIEVGADVRNAIVWEVLGRMCHLLADMSVPAHAHLDEHGLLPDSYENYEGGVDDPYRFWHADNAGPAIILNGPTRDVLHYLMYTTQQRADHFGSNGPANGNGNDEILGDARQAELDSLLAADLSSFGGPTTDAGPWSVTDLNVIRDKTLPYAIRATAGLLYWFSVAAGLMSPTSVTAPDAEGILPAVAYLGQNYPNPFNPSTTIPYELASRSYVTLAIFNTLGQRVTELVEGVVDPGHHEVRFDANGLTTGVYFCRLQVHGVDSVHPQEPGSGSEGVVQTRRIVLLR